MFVQILDLFFFYFAYFTNQETYIYQVYNYIDPCDHTRETYSKKKNKTEKNKKKVHFGPLTEGAPGYVHGGAIATIFDLTTTEVAEAFAGFRSFFFLLCGRILLETTRIFFFD